MSERAASSIEADSDLLHAHGREGRHAVAPPPIQACLQATSAHPLCGGKIAATSVAGQRHINVDDPRAGRPG